LPCIVQNTHGKETLCRVPFITHTAKKSIVGRKPSWKFVFAVYLQKTPGEDALCRVSNWRHPAKKDIVILPSSLRVTRHVAVFFAECEVVALGKEPLCCVFFFAGCIFPILPCSYSSPGANTRQSILCRVLVFGTRRRVSLPCTREKTLGKE
jgi:hypothetical protein